MPYDPVAADLAIESARNKLHGVAHRPGTVLFSGIDTLKPGRFYLMGYNPGGRADNPALIGASLDQPRQTGNAWVDEYWGPKDTWTTMQLRVHSVFAALGADLKLTFSTNALFLRSGSADKLEGPWELWWSHCWPVHQIFLDVVRPKVIVCLGNPSTLELLRTPRRNSYRTFDRVWDKSQEENLSQGTSWIPSVELELGDGNKHTCAVLALPHPSQRVHKGWDGCSIAADALPSISKARAVAASWRPVT